MRNLLFLALFLMLAFASNSQAVECTFTWTANAPVEKIMYYSLYKNNAVFVKKISTNKHVSTCSNGTYYVTATNKYGESGNSNRVLFGKPSPPKKFRIE